MIINQAMARRYWPNENVIGKRIGFGPENDPGWTTIVGVVGDIKDQPDSSGTEPAFWWPLEQMLFSFQKMSVVMRASEPALLANHLREAVQRLDDGLAVADVQVMDEIADRSFSTPRFVLFLVALFAGLALTLAMTGIHGVISYTVGQRMHEFGMRVALGASRGDIVRLVLRQGFGIAVIGVVAGLVGAAALSRFLGTLLYEVKHLDPLTFVSVGLIAIVVAAAACYVPARRATSADPIQALRID
jgi:ABC-type antimicrobial peptide transport system permease subunit